MQERLRRTLAVLGPSPARALTDALQISQSTLSRLVRQMGSGVVVGGRARATRYGARRRIVGVDDPIPVYRVDAAGGSELFSRLYPVEPAGCWHEPAVPLSGAAPAAWFPDLPWFLQDARPAGFLGRLAPLRHPELGLPSDIRAWSSDHVLRFLTRQGDDVVGAFIVGDDAWQRFRLRDAVVVDVDEYPRLAETVLSSGIAGSSAAGEQPKFLAQRRDDDGGARHVLVKFSPKLTPAGNDAVARRVADLLVCEHLALQTLRAAGMPSSSSSLHRRAGRTFLEVERFDRTPAGGRRGLASLSAIDAEHVGSEQRSWPESTAALLRQGIVDVAAHDRVRFLHLFGGLIGNSDMHFGNLSFFLDGARVTGLAPIYDMLPTRYAPVGGELVDRPVELRVPTPKDAGLGPAVVAAARRFWQAVVDEDSVAADVHAFARAHLQAMVRL